MFDNLRDVKCTDRAKERVQPSSGEFWNYVESCKATRSGTEIGRGRSLPNNNKQIRKSDKRLIPNSHRCFRQLRIKKDLREASKVLPGHHLSTRK